MKELQEVIKVLKELEAMEANTAEDVDITKEILAVINRDSDDIFSNSE
jgi:hypothetical protein